jgi:hypothetical protein
VALPKQSQKSSPKQAQKSSPKQAQKSSPKQAQKSPDQRVTNPKKRVQKMEEKGLTLDAKDASE